MRDDSNSLWRVVSGAGLAYYAAFTLQVIAGAVILVATGSLSETAWPMLLVDVLQEIGLLAVGATATSFIVIDGGAAIMVLTQRFRDELRKQAREEGLEEGLEKGRDLERKAWVEWNQRRSQAMAEGREFTEAPPHEK